MLCCNCALDRGFEGYDQWACHHCKARLRREKRERIQDALKQAEAAESVRWNRSQLSVVGKGRAGKTAFVRAMLGKAFVADSQSTVGMEGMTCELSTVMTSGEKRWREQTDFSCELALAQVRQAATIYRGKAMHDSYDLIQSLEAQVHVEEKKVSHSETHDDKTKQKDAERPERRAAKRIDDTTRIEHKVEASSSSSNFSSQDEVVKDNKLFTSSSELNEVNGDDGISKFDQNLVMKSMHEEGFDDAIVFELWDYGGQEVFYALFHFFITKYGMYAVLFNMKDMMAGEEKVQVCLDFIDFWLSTIYLHTRDPSTQSCSPILMVGTFKDEVSDPLQHLYISKVLERKFQSHLAWPSVRFLDSNVRSMLDDSESSERSSDDSESSGSSSDDSESLESLLGLNDSGETLESLLSGETLESLLGLNDLQLKSSSDDIESLESSMLLGLNDLQVRLGEFSCSEVVREIFDLCDTTRSGQFSSEAVLKVVARETLVFYPVDNTKALEDPVIPLILREIEQIARAADYIKHRVPYAWIRCFDKLMASKRDVYKLSEVETLARACGMPTSRRLGLTQEVLEMLKYLHNLGKVMYHHEKSLSDYVIAKPVDFIIRPVTQVVCEYSLHKPAYEAEARRMGRDWKDLQTRAILSKSLLQVLWKDHTEKFDLLVSLCVKFGIFVPLRPENDGDLTSFLVPNLLREEPLDQSEMARPANALTCLMHFSSDTRLADKYGLKRPDLSNGFLPSSLFSSVLGQAMVWNQSTSGMEPQLSKRKAILSFGQHKFLLRELKQEKCFQLHVLVKNPKHVLERLRSIVSTVIATCMPNLRLHILLESGPHCVNLDVLISRVDEQADMWFGSELRTLEELKREFRPWLPSKDLLSAYDIFVSYRHGDFDSELVRKTYDVLASQVVGPTRRGVEVFYDQVRLKPGRRFDLDFMNALLCSTGAVPIVSLHALERMRKIDRDSPEDHLLMEWCLILELQLAGRLKFCVPLLVGKVEEGPAIGNFFASDPLSTLPQVVPTKTVEEVKSFLASKGWEPSRELESRTVQETVKRLSKNMAIQVCELVSSQGPEGPRSNSNMPFFTLYERVARDIMRSLRLNVGADVDHAREQAQVEEVSELQGHCKQVTEAAGNKADALRQEEEQRRQENVEALQREIDRMRNEMQSSMAERERTSVQSTACCVMM